MSMLCKKKERNEIKNIIMYKYLIKKHHDEKGMKLVYLYIEALEMHDIEDFWLFFLIHHR